MVDLFQRDRRPVRPGYWFAQKRYGIGAVPATTAGWGVTLLFLLLLGLAMKLLPTKAGRDITAFCLIAVFITVTWLKTDGGWRWRWGDDGRSDKPG